MLGPSKYPLRRNSSAPIAAGVLDGLDAEAGAALAQAGVSDLAQLGACDALVIARASRLAYTRVARWRSLARRLAPVARSAPAAREARPRVANDDTFSRSERPTPPPEPLVRIDADLAARSPARSREPETAGGPFA